MAYRTEPQSTGGGLDPFRIGGLLCLLPILGPPLLMGAVWLLVWTLLRRRWDLGRRWVVLALVLSLLPGWVSHQTRPGGPMADYLATHNALAVGAIRLAMRVDDTYRPGVTMPGFGGAVAPFWLPASVIGAMAIARLTRPKESPLRRREHVGVEVSKKVEKKLAKGITHPPDGWALGYTRDGRQLAIGDIESRHHVAVCGVPGSGKTTVLCHLLDGVAERHPVILIDCKASATLRRAVERIPRSVVWTIGGPVKWDALQGDVTAFGSKLLAAEEYGDRAGVYRAAAQRYVQWVGRVLDACGMARDPQLVAELLSPKALSRIIRQAGPIGPAGLAEIADLVADMGKAELEGVAGFASRYGVTVEGVVGQSLGTGVGTLSLERAIRQGRTVLFSLDAAAYPMEARKVGAWALIDLVRVAGLLQADGWGVAHQAYFVVDEFSALEREGRHVVPLLARAREAGIGCVVATQGLADLARVDRALPQQLVQNVAVRVMMRQSSNEDARAWAEHAGEYEREDVSRRLESGWGGDKDTGISTTHWRRDFHVSPDELRVLGVGDAVVWVAPVGRGQRRIERVRVAPPRALRMLPAPPSGHRLLDLIRFTRRAA